VNVLFSIIIVIYYALELPAASITSSIYCVLKNEGTYKSRSFTHTHQTNQQYFTLLIYYSLYYQKKCILNLLLNDQTTQKVRIPGGSTERDEERMSFEWVDHLISTF